MTYMWWTVTYAAVLTACTVMIAISTARHRRWLREFERAATRADEAWQAEMDRRARAIAATQAEIEAHRDELRGHLAHNDWSPNPGDWSPQRRQDWQRWQP